MKRLTVFLLLLLFWACKGNRTSDDVKVQRDYFPNGALKSEFETIDSIKNGKFIEYFPDGKVHYKLRYELGMLEGPGFEYYPNGQIETVSVFSKGKVNGDVIFYFDDGKKKSKGKYFNDLKVGKNYQYYRSPDQRIKSVADYIIIGNKSELAGLIRYDTSGRVVEQTPSIEFKEIVDSLQLTIKHKTFEKSRLVIGKYDMFFNLRSAKDTIESSGNDVIKIPYTRGDTIRGYVENYERLDANKTISRPIWFSYPRTW